MKGRVVVLAGAVGMLAGAALVAAGAVALWRAHRLVDRLLRDETEGPWS